MGGAQPLDQHRAGLFFDPHPSLFVQCRERETRGQECVRRRLCEFTRFQDLAIINFEFEHLFGVGPILPLDGSGDYPRVRDGCGQGANDH
jgi:hypothetical protein